ncbi:MAG: Tetratricopeptide TPR_2 repeat protein, partial [Methanoculleus marisnigri]
LGQYAEAVRSFDRVLENRAMTGMKWIGSSSDLALFERDEPGTPRKQKPLKFDVLSEIVYNFRGIALLHLGRYAEAQEDFEHVIEVDPGNVSVLQQSGIALLHLGRYDEANLCLDSVLEREPYNAVARSMKADALMNLGRPPRQEHGT